MSDGKWSTSTSYIVATDAKAHTPMSSYQVPLNLSDADSEEVRLRPNTIVNSLILGSDLPVLHRYKQ